MSFVPRIKVAERDRILEELHKRGAVKPCPRCGNSDFTLLDGYFYQPIIDRRNQNKGAFTKDDFTYLPLKGWPKYRYSTP